jgi:hypothetical protein
MAGLRSREHWVAGMPTFDIHAPQFQPFPYRFGRFGDSAEAGVLSLEEMFELLEVLPVASRDTERTADLVQPLLRWAREHPESSRKFPASAIVRGNLHAVESARIRAIESPLAGTYALRVTLPGGQVVRAFLRTQRNATSGWRIASQAGEPNPLAVPRFDGYYLLSMVAADLQDLPAQAYGSVMHGYLSAMEEPERTEAGELTWEGTFELNLLSRGLPGHTRIQRVDSLRSALPWSRRSPSEANTVFTRTRNGLVRFEGELLLAGGETVHIQGERISTDVVSDPVSR